MLLIHFSIPFVIKIQNIGTHIVCKGEILKDDSMKIERYGNQIILEGLPVADVNHPKLPNEYFNEILRKIGNINIPQDLLLKIFNLWLNFHMSALIGNDLSKEAYKKTLLKPYLMHIQSNSSAILNSMANNIPSTVIIIERSLIILSSITLVICILVALLIFNFKITSFVITFLPHCIV